MKTDYRTRTGYKNLQLGSARIVYAKEDGVRNLTFYIHSEDYTYMFDSVLSNWRPQFSFNVY